MVSDLRARITAFHDMLLPLGQPLIYDNIEPEMSVAIGQVWGYRTQYGESGFVIGQFPFSDIRQYYSETFTSFLEDSLSRNPLADVVEDHSNGWTR